MYLVLGGCLVLGCVACGGQAAPPPAATPAPAAASLPPGHPPIGPGGSSTASAGSAEARLSGTIRLAAGLAARPGAVLYVVAKKDATTLLARRVDAPAFPFAFELDESDAMVSGIALEGPVDVVARLSRTGDAIPAKGDLEGTSRGVTLPASGVQVTIDTVRP
jgi:cytochrome c-type biogenesis protein CcmH